ncbi:hypothetical protein GQ457_04G039110 [Hibiscus cannabinus]
MENRVCAGKKVKLESHVKGKSDKKAIAEYSSFTDIDPDDMPPCESPSYSFHPFCCACAKIRHRHGRCN